MPHSKDDPFEQFDIAVRIARIAKTNTGALAKNIALVRYFTLAL